MLRRPQSLVVRVSQPGYAPLPRSKGKWAASVSAVVGVTSVLKQTLFQGVSQYFDQMVSDGKRVPVSENILSLTQKAMDDLKYPQDERKLLRVTTTSSMRMETIGSTDTIFGACIRVPKYIYASNLRASDLKIMKDLEEWGVPKEDIMCVFDTFALSNDAKLYCIARELIKSKTCLCYVLQSVIASIFSFGYVFGILYLDQTLLSSRLLALRYITYFNLAVVTILLCFQVSSLISAHWDKKAEEMVVTLGETYKTGGVEFCEKAVQRYALLDKYLVDGLFFVEGLLATMDITYSDRVSILRGEKK